MVLKSIWSKNANTSAKTYLKYSTKYLMLKYSKHKYTFYSQTSNYNTKHIMHTVFCLYSVRAVWLFALPVGCHHQPHE